MKTITPPLKWHGGKHYLATRLVGLMPDHTHYVEPYAGGLAVLLAKSPVNVSEVVNDINGDLTNFWRVLQDPAMFEVFQRRMEAVPFSEIEWRRAESRRRPINDPVERAVVFFIRCRQSLAGRFREFATLSRTRTRRRMNEQASAWLTTVESLPVVHSRLKRVVILHRDALDVIRQQDGPATLFYCDPPYPRSTRATPDVYTHEMNDRQHVELLDTLADIEGKFLLSGYPNDLYADAEVRYGWRHVDFDLPNHAAGGKRKAREVERVWMNFRPELPKRKANGKAST